MIDIKGLDKAKVLMALYNNSKQVGRGFFNMNGLSNLSYEQAKKILAVTTKFDYLYGRVIKADLTGDSFEEFSYDRDNGLGAAQKAVDSIKTLSEDNSEPESLGNQVFEAFAKSNPTGDELNSIANMLEKIFREKYPDRTSEFGKAQTIEEKEIEKQVVKDYDRVIFLKADQGVLFVVKNYKYGAVSSTTGEVILPCSFDKYCDAVKEWERLGSYTVTDENTFERKRK